MKENSTLFLTLFAFFIAGFQAVLAQDDEGDPRVPYFLDKINNAKALIDKYVSPKQQTYLVDEQGEQWLQRAVSNWYRKEWAKTTSMTDKERKQVYAALDALATAASKKLPLYKPEAKRFAFTDPVEINLMKSKVPNLDDMKVLKIGLADDVWRVISKGGIPTQRYKEGYMWFKYNDGIEEHPYCHMYQINVVQNYEGGGTYGASYGNYVMEWLSGCP